MNNIPLRIKTEKGGYSVPKYPDECEEHTPAPRGPEWFKWATEMRKTHTHRQCKGCGLWAIWEPIRKQKTSQE